MQKNCLGIKWPEKTNISIENADQTMILSVIDYRWNWSNDDIEVMAHNLWVEWYGPYISYGPYRMGHSNDFHAKVMF